MTSPDEDFTTALFLVNHPAWTHQDLMDCPAHIVDLMKDIENGREKVAKAKAEAATRGG